MKTQSRLAAILVCATASLVQDAFSVSGNTSVPTNALCAIPESRRSMPSGDHAQTLRRVEQIPELLKQVPLSFHDSKHQVDYLLERSPGAKLGFDLIASKDGRSERLQLIWGMGTGRGLPSLAAIKRADMARAA